MNGFGVTLALGFLIVLAASFVSLGVPDQSAASDEHADLLSKVIDDDAFLPGEQVGQARLASLSIPETTCTIQGEMRNGYYVEPPTVSFSVVDDPGSFFTTYYSVNYYGSWNVYYYPFEIYDQGNVQIGFYSADDEGNSEYAEYRNLQIDYSPPTINFFEAGVSGFMGRTVVLSWHVYDSYSYYQYAVTVYISVDGGPEEVVESYSGSYEISGLSVGTHSAVLRAVDQALNTDSGEVEFDIPSFSLNSPFAAFLIAAGISAAIAVPLVLYLRMKSKQR